MLSVGGLIGNKTGTVSQSYSSGLVSGAGNLGGLIGNSNGNVTSSYWDTDTSRRNISAAGSPLTTAQFQSGLPGGFDATVWGIGGLDRSAHPYLLWQLPSGTQVIDGYVYADGGITLAGNGIVVSALVECDCSASLGGTVTTGANGSYNFLLPPGMILASGVTGSDLHDRVRMPEPPTGRMPPVRSLISTSTRATSTKQAAPPRSAACLLGLPPRSAAIRPWSAASPTGPSTRPAEASPSISRSMPERCCCQQTARSRNPLRSTSRTSRCSAAARASRSPTAPIRSARSPQTPATSVSPTLTNLDIGTVNGTSGVTASGAHHAQREWRHRGDRGGERRHIYASERQLESGHRFAAQLYCPEFRHQWRLVPARRSAATARPDRPIR